MSQLNFADIYRLCSCENEYGSLGSIVEGAVWLDCYGSAQNPKFLCNSGNNPSNKEPIKFHPENTKVLNGILPYVSPLRIVSEQLALVRRSSDYQLSGSVPRNMALGAREVWLTVSRRPFRELWPSELMMPNPKDYMESFSPGLHPSNKDKVLNEQDLAYQEPHIYEVDVAAVEEALDRIKMLVDSGYQVLNFSFFDISGSHHAVMPQHDVRKPDDYPYVVLKTTCEMVDPVNLQISVSKHDGVLPEVSEFETGYLPTEQEYIAKHRAENTMRLYRDTNISMLPKGFGNTLSSDPFQREKEYRRSLMRVDDRPDTHVWQFNLRFDIENNAFNPAHAENSQARGVDFNRHRIEGVPFEYVVQGLMKRNLLGPHVAKYGLKEKSATCKCCYHKRTRSESNPLNDNIPTYVAATGDDFGFLIAGMHRLRDVVRRQCLNSNYRLKFNMSEGESTVVSKETDEGSCDMKDRSGINRECCPYCDNRDLTSCGLLGHVYTGSPDELNTNWEDIIRWPLEIAIPTIGGGVGGLGGGPIGMGGVGTSKQKVRSDAVLTSIIDSRYSNQPYLVFAGTVHASPLTLFSVIDRCRAVSDTEIDLWRDNVQIWLYRTVFCSMLDGPALRPFVSAIERILQRDRWPPISKAHRGFYIDNTTEDVRRRPIYPKSRLKRIKRTANEAVSQVTEDVVLSKRLGGRSVAALAPVSAQILEEFGICSTQNDVEELDNIAYENLLYSTSFDNTCVRYNPDTGTESFPHVPPPPAHMNEPPDIEIFATNYRANDPKKTERYYKNVIHEILISSGVSEGIPVYAEKTNPHTLRVGAGHPLYHLCGLNVVLDGRKADGSAKGDGLYESGNDLSKAVTMTRDTKRSQANFNSERFLKANRYDLLPATPEEFTELLRCYIPRMIDLRLVYRANMIISSNFFDRNSHLQHPSGGLTGLSKEALGFQNYLTMALRAPFYSQPPRYCLPKSRLEKLATTLPKAAPIPAQAIISTKLKDEYSSSQYNLLPREAMLLQGLLSRAEARQIIWKGQNTHPNGDIDLADPYTYTQLDNEKLKGVIGAPVLPGSGITAKGICPVEDVLLSVMYEGTTAAQIESMDVKFCDELDYGCRYCFRYQYEVGMALDPSTSYFGTTDGEAMLVPPGVPVIPFTHAQTGIKLPITPYPLTPYCGSHLLSAIHNSILYACIRKTMIRAHIVERTFHKELRSLWNLHYSELLMCYFGGSDASRTSYNYSLCGATQRLFSPPPRAFLKFKMADNAVNETQQGWIWNKLDANERLEFMTYLLTRPTTSEKNSLFGFGLGCVPMFFESPVTKESDQLLEIFRSEFNGLGGSFVYPRGTMASLCYRHLMEYFRSSIGAPRKNNLWMFNPKYANTIYSLNSTYSRTSSHRQQRLFEMFKREPRILNKIYYRTPSRDVCVKTMREEQLLANMAPSAQRDRIVALMADHLIGNIQECCLPVPEEIVANERDLHNMDFADPLLANNIRFDNIWSKKFS